MTAILKDQFSQQFKKLAHSKSITPIDIVLYNIVRGYPMDRGFSPIKNVNKLANGQKSAANLAKRRLRLAATYSPDQIVLKYNNIFGKVELRTIVDGALA